MRAQAKSGGAAKPERDTAARPASRTGKAASGRGSGPAQARKRGRPRRMSDEERRTQLMGAALGVFARSGFHAARIEDIVSEASTGKGTFYLHFRDKDDVLIALLEKFFEEIRQTLTWVGAKLPAARSLEELFEAEALRIFDILVKYRDLAGLFLSMRQQPGVKSRETVRQFYRDILHASEKNLALASDAGLLPPIHPRLASVCIVGAIEKIYETWLLGEIKEPKPELVRETLKFLLRGVGLQPGLERPRAALKKTSGRPAPRSYREAR